MPIQVSSEIGPLKQVIVHRPDEGIARISPKKAEELLFDDIVFLPQMQEEHDVLRMYFVLSLAKKMCWKPKSCWREP
jgi:arginine deiminase